MMKLRHVIWTGLLLIGSGLFAPLQAEDAAPWRSSTGTNEILITLSEWRDPTRDRSLPVKIYSPRSISTPLPVILFSHGLGGSREGYEYLGQYWATHGYISVHLQHPGSDDSVWKDVRVGQRMSAMRRAAAQPRHAVNRVQDISFALDELTRLNRTNTTWTGKFDLNRVGVAGHSFGAFTTLAAAGASYSGWTGATAGDARVKAAIPMSAPVPANRARLDAAFAGVKIPCLHMTGTEDDSPIGDTKAAERRLPFDHCRQSDQFLLTFTGGDHAIFGGRERNRGGARDAQFQQLICQSSLAFWDAHLRDDAKAKDWLIAEFPTLLRPAGVWEMKRK